MITSTTVVQQFLAHFQHAVLLDTKCAHNNQAPVYVVVFMNGLYSQDTLSNIEAGFVFRQCVFAHKQCHHVPSWQVLHNQVQILLILK